MTISMGLFLVFEVLGGLALFIFGMGVMTRGLRAVAGKGLRSILNGASSQRLSGLALGSLLGFLVHSSAASVMLVGFVNAGLMTLGQAIMPMVGANLGTTLSMQVISFRLDEYSFAAIALGFLLSLAAPHARGKQIGQTLLGFGMLFLGMRVMSAAIRPHREWLEPLLAAADGGTVRGMLTGLAAAALFTAVIQSSGATVGMCFALAGAGVFTRIEQVYPIVLGAHLGTCATALLGSVGTHVDARRTAIWHLLFNGLNVMLGLLAAPWLLVWIPRWSNDLVRQTAHVHTLVMALGAAVVLPLAPCFVPLLRRLYGRRLTAPAPSHLDPRWLSVPEQALRSCMLELQRVLHRLQSSLRLDGELFFAGRQAALVMVQRNEEFVNEIKTAMTDYLAELTRQYLSRRQMILVQHISRCMSEIERIGDHVAQIAELCRRRLRHGTTGFVTPASFDDLFEAYRRACHVVVLLPRSLEPDLAGREKLAREVLAARDAYFRHSRRTQEAFAEEVARHQVSPVAALFFGELLNAIDRMVRHARIIALAELHADFWIKQKKLDRAAPPLPMPAGFQPLDAPAYLQALEEVLAGRGLFREDPEPADREEAPEVIKHRVAGGRLE